MFRKVGKIDYRLAVVIGLLLVFGLFMLSSASAAIAFERFGDSYYFVKRQLLFGLMPGLIAFAVLVNVDYRLLKRVALPLFALSVFLLVLVLIPGVGKTTGGAQRWIDAGFFEFQPSEIVKLTLLIYLGAWLANRSKVLHEFRRGLLPFLTILGLVLFLILIEPDLGTVFIIAFTAVVVYFLAGAPIKHILVIIAAGATALVGLIVVAPYRLKRFLTFLDPGYDPQGIGYHINQAYLAIGSGGLWGRGFGHSRAKFQYLPEATGDSIFAIIGEELGLVLSVLLILAFAYLFLRGLSVAESAPDDFGRWLAAGIIIWFIGQAFVNIGAMLGLLPLTGLPLPFISYGGTSLAMNLAAAGILLNISRYAREK